MVEADTKVNEKQLEVYALQCMREWRGRFPYLPSWVWVWGVAAVLQQSLKTSDVHSRTEVDTKSH